MCGNELRMRRCTGIASNRVKELEPRASFICAYTALCWHMLSARWFFHNVSDTTAHWFASAPRLSCASSLRGHAYLVALPENISWWRVLVALPENISWWRVAILVLVSLPYYHTQEVARYHKNARLNNRSESNFASCPPNLLAHISFWCAVAKFGIAQFLPMFVFFATPHMPITSKKPELICATVH